MVVVYNKMTFLVLDVSVRWQWGGLQGHTNVRAFRNIPTDTAAGAPNLGPPVSISIGLKCLMYVCMHARVCGRTCVCVCWGEVRVSQQRIILSMCLSFFLTYNPRRHKNLNPAISDTSFKPAFTCFRSAWKRCTHKRRGSAFASRCVCIRIIITVTI